jgi:acyl-CoA synthetase (AMP-forming)/AMP-acid ligase II
VRGSEIKIVDEQGNEVPAGEQGELIWRGTGMMKGYLKEPELTKKVLRNGYYYTGDLAKKDELGMVYITGRIDDVINCAGFKIFPKEVEEVLKDHPAVFDCAVVGVPDEVKGSIPKAWVVLNKDQQVTEKELIDLCRSQMANYKAPREIVFIDEIPRSAIGKVDKKRLV